METVLKSAPLFLLRHSSLTSLILTYAIMQNGHPAFLFVVYTIDSIVIVTALYRVGRFIATTTRLGRTRHYGRLDEVVQKVVRHLGSYGMVGGLAVTSFFSPSIYLSALVAGLLKLDHKAATIGIVIGDLPYFFLSLAVASAALQLDRSFDVFSVLSVAVVSAIASLFASRLGQVILQNRRGTKE